MPLQDKALSFLKSAYWSMRMILRFPKHVGMIWRIADIPSNYPELPRKKKSKIRRENLRYLLKYKSVNPYYVSHGFDVEGFRDQSEFILHRPFVQWRQTRNAIMKRTQTGSYNYMVLLRDKYVFSAYLASAIGSEFVVPTLALIADGKAYDPAERCWKEPESVLDMDRQLVFKVLDGECADGITLAETRDDGLYANGEKTDRAAFIASLKPNRVIVQRVLKQHDALKAFQTKSVNTIRIVTIRGESGATNVFAAFLRLSASADSFVDNRAKGGLGVGIDMETGKLEKYGFPHDQFGTKTEIHPLSGIRFLGYQLPYWEEIKTLVCEAHRQFYEIRSIGWDVAITDNGPVLLEGNDDWEIGGPQDTMGGLKKRWEELLKK